MWANEQPLARLHGGQIQAIHVDHRNAPLALTDEARRVLWSAQVEDFGRAHVSTAPGAEGIEFNLRLSNQYFDAETGLHYNTHRFYDPVSQRYTSADPLGLAVGPDLHAFALNRPHTLADPLGLQPRLATDSQVSAASFGDKLGEIMRLALEHSSGTLSQDIRNAIQGAVDDLPTTVAIFVAWQIVSATPVGWLANGLLAAYTAYSVGSDALRVMQALGQWVAQVSNASNRAQLCATATSLGSLLNQLGIVAAQMINPRRVSDGLRRASGDLSRHAAPDQARSPRALTRLNLLRTRGCINPYGAAYDRMPETERRAYLSEYGRQVQRQQDALNNMTAADFSAARAAYTEARGRNPDASFAQRSYRDTYEASLRTRIRDSLDRSLSGSGTTPAQIEQMTNDRVRNVMNNSAALHEPDMFAGGQNSLNPTCMGSRCVNSSIGAQWRNIIGELDDYSRTAQNAGHGGARMQLQLRVCNRSGN